MFNPLLVDIMVSSWEIGVWDVSKGIPATLEIAHGSVHQTLDFNGNKLQPSKVCEWWNWTDKNVHPIAESYNNCIPTGNSPKHFCQMSSSNNRQTIEANSIRYGYFADRCIALQNEPVYRYTTITCRFTPCTKPEFSPIKCGNYACKMVPNTRTNVTGKIASFNKTVQNKANSWVAY